MVFSTLFLTALEMRDGLALYSFRLLQMSPIAPIRKRYATRAVEQGYPCISLIHLVRKVHATTSLSIRDAK